MNRYLVSSSSSIHTVAAQIVEADSYSVSQGGTAHFYVKNPDKPAGEESATIVGTVTVQKLEDLPEGTGGAGNPAHYTVKFLPEDIAKLRSMKGGNGEVPWMPSMKAGDPDTFLGRDITPEAP